MNVRILKSATRGIAAVTAGLFALSSIGTSVAETYRSYIDDALGTESYITTTGDSARFTSDYDTIEEMAAAAKELAIREGEEGTVVMKNDNDVLPLSGETTVALFGLAAYAPYPYTSGDLKAGNDDAVDLLDALKEAGITIDETLSDFYLTLMNEHEETSTHAWTGAEIISTAYDYIYNTTVGDMEEFQIYEVPPEEFESLGMASDWKEQIDTENTIGICVFARAAGESNMYGPGTAVDYYGNATGEDPLALSADELAVIDAARETCSKVIVLLNTGNTMMISDIAEGGEHEVDGIVYIGCPNDYQFTGIVNVLTGAANATGALTDTYVTDNASIPAVQNLGGYTYTDYEVIASDGDDERYPGEQIDAYASTSSFGGDGSTYSAGSFIVEAEGIYLGYKYYETRYFDSIVNPDFGADSSAGATQSDSWDYGEEVVYSFGHSLSYLEFEQEVKNVEVDLSEDGMITAVIEVTNLSDQDGTFLTQLYVSQPYTEYDQENLVEKSAIMFLNSAKVDVAAGQTQEVTIEIGSKYLASYDSNGAETYILDEGDYYFTAAAGSHEAVNNVLAAMGYTTDDGMDAEAVGSAVVWNELTELDATTFSTSNGTQVTNVFDDADLNYWTGEDTVIYLSRQDWESTWPVTYGVDVEVTIRDSDKADEWIATLRGDLYDVETDNPAEEGEDLGLRLTSEDIGEEELEDITNEFWDSLVSQITIDEAVGAVLHGGSQSDTLTNIDNPVVTQNEGVSGFTAGYYDEESGTTYYFNVNSMTLLGSSFNPELAYEWGLIEGNSGLWLEQYILWGVGLTTRRTPYNGRNYEYVSEDSMLANVIGAGVIQGCSDKGIMNGPKHIGANDQEHMRAGIAEYMTEQRLRESDLRSFQGALEDADGMAVMAAFNRIGATCAAGSSALLKSVLREEWGYTGVISSDMMNNSYYFPAEAMIMATVTMVADFATGDNHINQGEGGVDSTWPYISESYVENDATLVEQARENLKYQLYTFANSAVLNVSTTKVAVWWDTALAVLKYGGLALAILSALAYAALTLMPEKNPEDKEETA